MRGPALRRSGPFAAWLIALALLPWWLGLPLLLGIAAALLAQVERLQPWQGPCRGLLRWGLPGAAFALGRGFDEAALAWTVAAVALLAGFTLLAGLETWLDRHQRRASAGPPPPPEHEWPRRVQAPSPAGSGIIELVPVQWRHCEGEPLPLPASMPGGHVRYVREAGFAGFRLDDGRGIEAPPGRCAIDPAGGWLAVELAPGVLLWHAGEGRSCRLRRRQLCGWFESQPWLQSGEGEMPLPLEQALRREPAH